MHIKLALGHWGSFAVRRHRAVLLSAGLLALIAAPFAIRALRNIDTNLFNQASNDLLRFQLMRSITEKFGGDMLLAVVEIPDDHSQIEIQELKAFAQLLTAEMATVGSFPEDQAAWKMPSSESTDAPPLWLRNVECQTGQSLNAALKILLRQPHLLLDPNDVDHFKALFEPAALDARMEQIEVTVRDLDALSPEKKNYTKIRWGFSNSENMPSKRG